MKLIEGQLIHRRYRLDSRLAQGGMGEVWKGYDIQLGREVAIKALRSDMTNAEAKLRRLRAEAHNSANLAHPNIAALFEYYEHDGIGFLIMEYVPSKSLADLFHSKGAMDPIELLPILIQTARGLFVAHSHGVIHRDVKPANIMVSDTGEVKITDFGVSYSTGQGQITQDGMVVVVVSMSGEDGALVSGPDIITRGFVYVKESEGLMEELRQVALDSILSVDIRYATDWSAIKQTIKGDLSNYLYKKTKRSPMILPVIMEV